MKKTTAFALAIIAIACGSMLFLFDVYTGQFLEEIAHAKEVTTEFREGLAPETTIKLARVRGGARYVVHDESRLGLLVDASPSEASWATDASGLSFARPVAIRLFEVYGPERPIGWIQFRLLRPDRTQLPLFGLERAEGGGIAVLEPDAPAASPGGPTGSAATPKPGPGAPAPGK